jgi:quinol monooxygenase YgiN
LPPSSLIVQVAYSAQPEQVVVARHELTTLITTVVSSEPACLGIQLFEDPADPTRLLLWERWTSQAAYTGPHMQTPHLQAFIQRAPGFLAGPPQITFWQQLEERGRTG